MRARSVYGEIPGTSLIDWPIALEELEPYYDLAEAKMKVTGTNGLPPLPPNNNFKVMYWGAKRLGFDVSTGRHAINSVAYDGRPATIQDGFTITGDKTGSRWSTLNVEIPRALATGKLELRPQSRAVQIEHDEAGNASGVVYSRWQWRAPAPEGAGGGARRQLRREPAAAAALGKRAFPGRPRQWLGPCRRGTICATSSRPCGRCSTSR